MKRCHSYEINHSNNTVVVSKVFMENATQLDSKEEILLRRFNKMGLKIIQQTARKHKKRNLGKPALLTYQMMMDYITLLDDADVMMAEFNAVRKTAEGRGNRTQYVNKWFRETFPRYDAIPEFDEYFNIVHNPNAA